ncbi:MAG TPA: ATP-binding protein [Blastocatellia bacterium]|nr:ATP-binding protein [Blastocatellia bacterium]
MRSFESVIVAEEAHIGQAKRVVRRCASEAGFGERQLAEIEIAINEIATNSVKFGRGTGRIFFAPADESLDNAGLEIIYMDKGPGIEDLNGALEDGFTTAGSLGAGLGAIKRMADEFHIYSTPERQTFRLPLYGRTTHGTVIVFKKWLNAKPREQSSRRELWAAMTRASQDGEANGDAYIIRRDGDRRLVAVIDGLGHGFGAKEAASETLAVIEKRATEPLENILRVAHESLKQTRGAVAGLAAIDLAKGVIEFAGIGNTDCRVLGGRDAVRFISLNGTLGSRMERVKVFREQLPKVATVVMTTDGVSERWDAANYPGLLGQHPSLLCAAILRDFSRPNDDATIVCGRLQT